MKIFIILTVTISFFSCAKKQIPHFLNFNHQSISILDKQIENSPKNTIIENSSQNQNLASISENNPTIFEDLPKERFYNLNEQKNTPNPLVERKKARRLSQIIALKKSISKEKPNYDKLNQTSGTMGIVSVLSFLSAIGLASFLKFSQFGIVYFLLVSSLITANVGLVLGIISIKKADQQGKSFFGIFIGILWDIIFTYLLFSFR